VVAHDWRAFFRARVDEVAPHAPLGGLTGGGWRLSYSDKPNERLKAIQKEDKLLSFNYSLGFTLKEEGQVTDVIPGSPAARAGLGPAMRLIGVNGRKLFKELLDDVLKLGKTPIELLVLNADYYKILKVDYRGGARNPHLERDAARPNLLEA